MNAFIIYPLYVGENASYIYTINPKVPVNLDFFIITYKVQSHLVKNQ